VDIIYKGRTRSHWREFEFMLHQIQRATDLNIELVQIMPKWNEIRESLSEATRKRRPQTEAFSLS